MIALCLTIYLVAAAAFVLALARAARHPVPSATMAQADNYRLPVATDHAA